MITKQIGPMGSSSLKHSEGRCRSLRVYRPPKFAGLAAQTGTAWEGETKGLLDFRKPKRGAKKPQKIEVSWDFIKNMWDSFLQHLRESHDFLTDKGFSTNCIRLLLKIHCGMKGSLFEGGENFVKLGRYPNISKFRFCSTRRVLENPLVSLLITPAVVLLVELVGSGFV